MLFPSKIHFPSYYFFAVRSEIGLFSRTEYCFCCCPFGNLVAFPDGVLFLLLSVREFGCFPERSVVSVAVRSGIGLFSRTEYCFCCCPFGIWVVFPDGVLFLLLSVRELGCFPERSIVFGVIRSGIGVFFRTEGVP